MPQENGYYSAKTDHLIIGSVGLIIILNGYILRKVVVKDEVCVV